MDLVVRVPRLPGPGETVLGGRFSTSLGGKGANQAVAAARAALAGPVAFVAACGDDAYGRGALAALSGEPRLSTRHVRIVPGEATGVASIAVDEHGENIIAVASGANLHLAPADVDALPDDAWRAARVLLACLETPLETVVRALARAGEFGLMTILNPAPVPPGIDWRDVLLLVDVLTPNEIEAAALTGGGHPARLLSVSKTGAASPTDPLTAARHLRAAGAGAVIVTRGAAGCAIATGEDETHLPARQVTAVDTTAAGDAFNGALAVALAEGRPLVDAARFATSAAALSVTRPGAIASLPRRAEIEKLMMNAE
ncbi:MAG: ribokinase [Planctomycetia bacterium]|nr:ribokinase [Planctomycetia bacterium]